MPDSETLDRIAAFWAESLGCDQGMLRTPGVAVLPNAAQFADYSGAYLLCWNQTCVLTAPPQHIAHVAAATAGQSCDAIFDAGALAAIFKGDAERIIGPATQACIDERDFRPAAERGTRTLTTNDAAALRQLAAACDPSEWDHSGIESEGAIPFGCFAGEELVAAGMLRAGGNLRHIGIVTHPAFRGKGYGRAVVSAMTQAALDEGALPHYQTLASNTASRSIARSLGFTEYARTLAVRLRAVPL